MIANVKRPPPYMLRGFLWDCNYIMANGTYTEGAGNLLIGFYIAKKKKTNTWVIICFKWYPNL